MKLVVIAPKEDTWPHIITDAHIAKLREMAPELDVVLARGEDDLSELTDADIMVGSPRKLPEVTDALNVQWIHSFSAGVDRVLNEYVKNNDNILVSNSSGIHATPIAEHIIGLMLMHTRKFGESIKRQIKKTGTAHKANLPSFVTNMYSLSVWAQ